MKDIQIQIAVDIIDNHNALLQEAKTTLCFVYSITLWRVWHEAVCWRRNWINSIQHDQLSVKHWRQWTRHVVRCKVNFHCKHIHGYISTRECENKVRTYSKWQIDKCTLRRRWRVILFLCCSFRIFLQYRTKVGRVWECISFLIRFPFDANVLLGGGGIKDAVHVSNAAGKHRWVQLIYKLNG